ncbi:hypothetical protein Tco_1284944 [Tanacetum coccineum]
MEKGLSPKGIGRGKGVKEKQSSVMENPGIVCDHVGRTTVVNVPSSVVPTTMENVVMSLDVDELVVASGNNKGTEDRKL